MNRCGAGSGKAESLRIFVPSGLPYSEALGAFPRLDQKLCRPQLPPAGQEAGGRPQSDFLPRPSIAVLRIFQNPPGRA